MEGHNACAELFNWCKSISDFLKYESNIVKNDKFHLKKNIS